MDGVLVNSVFAALLLWLARSSGDEYPNVKIFIALNVTVTRGYCYYNNRLFNSTLYSKDLCAQMTCMARQKEVEVVECSPLETGCQWKKPGEEFPQCCERVCPEPRNARQAKTKDAAPSENNINPT
ncbi:uncharacterized protein LOC119434126 [Dermacentor silvarum]|uniref:uncharacterized protein LOC119434126 n=1 Tax=Dermacentor silvarum TaxID=543639 RepID=UPI00210172DD|nr:uncharacterized protein LOC119434126 [Dermacentor silvarum]